MLNAPTLVAAFLMWTHRNAAMPLFKWRHICRPLCLHVVLDELIQRPPSEQRRDEQNQGKHGVENAYSLRAARHDLNQCKNNNP